MGIPIPTTQKGLDIIEKMILSLTENSDDNFRMIIFIDDLDRCSPETAIEVFESVKVLLNVKGMVHVMGLSRDTVEKLITHKFKIHDISGEEYIQKIIQLPITIPDWKTSNIKKIIEHNILSKLGKTSPYYKTIKGKENLITNVSKSNPRETKRLINRFIVDYEFLRLQNSEFKIDDENAKYSFFVISLMKYLGQTKIINIISNGKEDSEAMKLMDMLLEISRARNEDEYKDLVDSWNLKEKQE